MPTANSRRKPYNNVNVSMSLMHTPAPSSVVYPCDHIHDYGKGQQTQKCEPKTVHAYVLPPRSLEKVNPPK
jgi:hypothetical protein